MYIYVELWKFRQSWLDLSKEQREAWMNELIAGIGGLLEAGVESLAFAFNDSDTPHSSGYDYVAVWRMPNKELVEQFEKAVEDSGLHNYYEQVNTRGKEIGLDVLTNEHISLER